MSVREIRVPGPWQAQFPDLRTRGGTGIYRQEFDVPPGWLTERAYLRFGAVFHTAYVYVNGPFSESMKAGFCLSPLTSRNSSLKARTRSR